MPEEVVMISPNADEFCPENPRHVPVLVPRHTFLTVPIDSHVSRHTVQASEALSRIPFILIQFYSIFRFIEDRLAHKAIQFLATEIEV